MLLGRSFKAVVCLVLWSNVASAGLVNPHLRLRADTTALATNTDADTNKNTPTSTPTPTATKTDATTATGKATASSSKSTSAQAKSTAQDDASTATSETATPTSILPSIAPASTTSSLNTTIFNSTITAGQLPLKPTVTPAYGVGGIILLVTGVVFALVGVRKRWLQTFFSTAYLGALGTTVLILYVMSLPVSNAVQGAYLVAVVATGLVLGALAIIFKEIAEGFGCLLGGFSFSMWLMCLRPGGLVQSSGGTIGFIVGFTVCAYAFYFMHYTRHHALLVCIAFGGSTAAVLGIDCFSRAGLKEFWAYVWRLNDDLFPLGTVTYPITRGIKVELAAIILLFCAGVVSQLKLWRLVQEHRAKRDADRIEDEQKLAREEETVGRQIEAANARDREEWEAVYGDGTYVPGAVLPGAPGSTAGGNGSDTHSGDSGVCDMDSQKGEKGEKQIAHSEDASSSQTGNEVIEMENMQPKGAAEIVMEQDAKDGAVTVRVAQDEYPEGLPPDEAVASRRSSQPVSAQPVTAQPVTASPGIVPLPFTVPTNDDDKESDDKDDKDDDRSSVATFAAEDEVVPSATARRRQDSPSTLAKRLSQGSAGLFRSISQRSKRANAGAAGTTQNGQSKEELVSRRASAMMIRHVQDDDDDDNSSLAVTMDGMSSIDDEIDDEINDEVNNEVDDKAAETDPKEIEVKAQLASDADASSLKTPKADKQLSASTEPTESPAVDEKVPEKRSPQDESAISATPSTTANLTKDRLPRSLSRVAMSYRTNEWAKHLSNAEAPHLETIQLGEPLASPTTGSAEAAVPASPAREASPTIDEAPAQLNLAELQQTAETGAPAPAAPRTASVHGALSRSASHQSLDHSKQNMPYNPLQADTSSSGINSLPSRNSFAGVPGAAMGVNSIANGWRSSSANQVLSARGGLVHEPIAEEDTVPGSVAGSAVDDSRNTLTPPTSSQSQRVVSLAPVPGIQSFSTPQTLIGQRDMLLRSKSQQGTYIGGSLVQSASATSLAPGLHNAYSMSQLPTISSGVSDTGSVYAGPSPTPTPGTTASMDLDDLPMSQRRDMMRQSSLMSLNGPMSPTGAVPASTVPFDSHQPKRDQQHLPTAAARQVQLATFRNSVAADLRSGMGNAPNTVTATGGRLRESMATAYGSTPLLSQYGSMASLQNGEGSTQSAMDLQRQFLISQKEAEAQRREMERLDKERASQAIEERMRRGDLLEAHRDAMRRMQASVHKAI